jgi:hypothetical protein
MKINQIISETTTAGAVAPVSQSFVKMSSRNPVVSSKKGNNLLTGKVTNKKYANSVNESKMKDLVMDLKSGPDGLTDEEFKKKYNKSKAEMRKAMRDSDKEMKQQKPEPVSEADLHEEDKIIAVGKGNKLKPGLLDKPINSMNPTDTVKVDVPFLIRLLEFAREDASSDMDLHDLAEKLVDRGRRGKTLTMKDYEYVVDKPQVDEKAVSKAQQRFMGMVHAVQKGEMKAPSKEVSKVAKGMSKKAGHDYAATKHKGLPEKVKK